MSPPASWYSRVLGFSETPRLHNISIRIALCLQLLANALQSLSVSIHSIWCRTRDVIFGSYEHLCLDFSVFVVLELRNICVESFLSCSDKLFRQNCICLPCDCHVAQVLRLSWFNTLDGLAALQPLRPCKQPSSIAASMLS